MVINHLLTGMILQVAIEVNCRISKTLKIRNGILQGSLDYPYRPLDSADLVI